MREGGELLPRNAIAVGDRIVGDRYRVRAVKGRGGAGQVFEVENETIGRRFALKILRCNIVSDEQVKRFHREARALGRISSPHVAQVIDFAIDPQIGPYLVMELLDGETLHEVLARRGRLPADEVVTLALELCTALDEVHRVGIVHRDLKPSNVGVPRDGAAGVKLLDFGIAASIDDAFTESLTHSQQFLGTMPYMAPELFQGTSPSPSFDLYAFGVVLFQLLTGKTPYVGATPAVYIQQHLFAPIPRIEDVAPDADVPAWLDDLVYNLLSKQPEQRLPSALAVREALLAGREGRAVRRFGARRRRWVLAAAALLAIGGGAALLLPRRASPTLPPPASAPPTTATPTSAPAPARAAEPGSAPAPAATPAATEARPMQDGKPRRRRQRRAQSAHTDTADPWNGEILLHDD
jgi:eukaryotic-like serine/threonine-protein kinase